MSPKIETKFHCVKVCPYMSMTVAIDNTGPLESEMITDKRDYSKLPEYRVGFRHRQTCERSRGSMSQFQNCFATLGKLCTYAAATVL